ncbi:hypothetical protein EX895_001022 [Sporisorium graminicola]|uniref:Ima1 N-terminal domain-containing protein n=1 Tax=Sporisorium graminicola TaxID=280036 RepID=A0A4U7L1G9_9BASI|nr:hypothetical protein EX895_001022 [Sporisorium graminicola]TKY91023.1 hypothetical protein EX895_001022 [Sporisorium graminicola]
MWKLLPWTGRGASGYPQRECFYCCTTSIILPPYSQQGASDDALGIANQLPNVATSSSASSISTGTPANWYCSSCHCQNVAEQDGTPVEQYTRPMWDEAWNRDRSQLMRHTRPHISKSAKAPVASSPDQRTRVLQMGSAGKAPFKFCHTCQTNQVLTLNMLADYLPSEEDSEYQQKLQQLPEYEASIAARYPPVCMDCAPKVEERITERDQFARSWSLGKWLDLKKKASSTGLVDLVDRASSTLVTQPEPSNSPHTTPLTPWPSKAARIKGTLRNIASLDDGSISAKVIFVLVNISIWAAYLATALWPHDVMPTLQGVADRIRSKPISWLTAEFGLVALFLMPSLLTKSSRMDPLKRSTERARARQLRVEVKGMDLWRTTQSVFLALRSVALLVTFLDAITPNDSAKALEWIAHTAGKSQVEFLKLAAMSLLVGEAGFTTAAASRLRVQPPTPLQLVSRPITAIGGQAKRSNQDSDALLTGLSLDDGAAARPSIGLFHDETIFDSHADKESGTTPRVERDADGDAVMEDAATYVARRVSRSSEDDWEDGSARIPAPPTSTWSPNWPSNGVSKQPGPTSNSAFTTTQGGRAGVGFSRYHDFQLGPQRFWEPQNPTGLEDVFGRAVSLDDAPRRNDDASSSKWSKWLGFS